MSENKPPAPKTGEPASGYTPCHRCDCALTWDGWMEVEDGPKGFVVGLYHDADRCDTRALKLLDRKIHDVDLSAPAVGCTGDYLKELEDLYHAVKLFRSGWKMSNQ